MRGGVVQFHACAVAQRGLRGRITGIARHVTHARGKKQHKAIVACIIIIRDRDICKRHAHIVAVADIFCNRGRAGCAAETGRVGLRRAADILKSGGKRIGHDQILDRAFRQGDGERVGDDFADGDICAVRIIERCGKQTFAQAAVACGCECARLLRVII